MSGLKTQRSRTRKPARGDQPQRLTESPADAGLPVAGESLPGQQSLPMELPTFTQSGKIIPRPGLVDWLKTLDFEAFLDDWTEPQMKKQVVAKCGKQKGTRVGPKEFKEAKRLAFDWWKSKTMRPERTDPRLSETQWDEVKRVVTEFLGTLQGLTLRQCVRGQIVRQLELQWSKRKRLVTLDQADRDLIANTPVDKLPVSLLISTRAQRIGCSEFDLRMMRSYELAREIAEERAIAGLGVGHFETVGHVVLDPQQVESAARREAKERTEAFREFLKARATC